MEKIKLNNRIIETMQESPAWLEFFNNFHTDFPLLFSNNGFPQELDLSNSSLFTKCRDRKYLEFVKTNNFKVSYNDIQVKYEDRDVEIYQDSPVIGDIFKIKLDCKDSAVQCTDCLVGYQEVGQTLEQVVWKRRDIVSTNYLIKIVGTNPKIQVENFNNIDFSAFKDAVQSLFLSLGTYSYKDASIRSIFKTLLNCSCGAFLQRRQYAQNPKFVFSAKGDIYNYKTFIGYDYILGTPGVTRCLGKEVLGYDKGILVIKNGDFPQSTNNSSLLTGYFVKDSSKTQYPVMAYFAGNSPESSRVLFAKKIEQVPHAVGNFDIGYSNFSLFSGKGLQISTKNLNKVKSKILDNLPARSAESVVFKEEVSQY